MHRHTQHAAPHSSSQQHSEQVPPTYKGSANGYGNLK